MKKILLTLVLVLVGLAIAYHLTPPTKLLDGAMRFEQRLAGLTEKTVTVNEHRWVYLEGGEGPPLLLLHGFSADSNNWLRLSRTLGRHYRIIAPDLIGFGQSSQPSNVDYDIASQARRVFEFADAIGLAQFDVGGSSMGGYIAGLMADQQPDRIRSMLLLAPGGVISAQPSEMFELILERDENPLIVRRVEDFDRTYDFIFSEPPWLPTRVKRGFAERQVDRVSIYDRIFAALRYESTALEESVDGLLLPTLIVWGEQDRVLHPSGAAILADILPHSTTSMLPGVGHLPMLEVPKTVAQTYLDWRVQQGI